MDSASPLKELEDQGFGVSTQTERHLVRSRHHLMGLWTTQAGPWEHPQRQWPLCPRRAHWGRPGPLGAASHRDVKHAVPCRRW